MLTGRPPPLTSGAGLPQTLAVLPCRHLQQQGWHTHTAVCRHGVLCPGRQLLLLQAVASLQHKETAASTSSERSSLGMQPASAQQYDTADSAAASSSDASGGSSSDAGLSVGKGGQQLDHGLIPGTQDAGSSAGDGPYLDTNAPGIDVQQVAVAGTGGSQPAVPAAQTELGADATDPAAAAIPSLATVPRDLHGDAVGPLSPVERRRWKVAVMSMPEDALSSNDQRRLRISKANSGKMPWNKGRKHSEATKEKIRAKITLHMQDKARREHLAQIQTGKTHGEETRKKISEANRRAFAAKIQDLPEAERERQLKLREERLARAKLPKELRPPKEKKVRPPPQPRPKPPPALKQVPTSLFGTKPPRRRGRPRRSDTTEADGSAPMESPDGTPLRSIARTNTRARTARQVQAKEAALRAVSTLQHQLEAARKTAAALREQLVLTTQEPADPVNDVDGWSRQQRAVANARALLQRAEKLVQVLEEKGPSVEQMASWIKARPKSPAAKQRYDALIQQQQQQPQEARGARPETSNRQAVVPLQDDSSAGVHVAAGGSERL